MVEAGHELRDGDADVIVPRASDVEARFDRAEQKPSGRTGEELAKPREVGIAGRIASGAG